MDKTQTSPSRENYEELDGLTEQEIEARVKYGKAVPFDSVVEEAQRIYLLELKHSYVRKARVEDDNGNICGFCGKPNDFADDIGWFYIQPEDEVKPCCEACFHGQPGQKHVQKYGSGDR